MWIRGFDSWVPAFSILAMSYDPWLIRLHDSNIYWKYVSPDQGNPAWIQLAPIVPLNDPSAHLFTVTQSIITSFALLIYLGGRSCSVRGQTARTCTIKPFNSTIWNESSNIGMIRSKAFKNDGRNCNYRGQYQIVGMSGPSAIWKIVLEDRIWYERFIFQVRLVFTMITFFVTDSS